MSADRVLAPVVRGQHGGHSPERDIVQRVFSLADAAHRSPLTARCDRRGR